MDKLEKHIKEKLQDREISPSPKAWNRIIEEVGVQETTQTRKKYWLAMAACLVGLMVLTIGFLRTRNTIQNTQEIVVSQENNKSEQPVLKTDNTAVKKALEETIEVVNVEAPIKETPKVTLKNNDSELQVAEAASSKEKEPLNDLNEVSELAITSKLEEVLMQVQAMEDNAVAVTDKEIDSLLLSAQKQLLTETVLNDNGKVDAMALLNEVESELYDDQRNPLFIKLKEGFFKLRTAVADRNN